MSPTPDPETEPVRAAIDSTVMLVLARFFMPVVVAVLGFMMSTTLYDLRTQLRKVVDIQLMAGGLQAGLTAKVDGAVKQLDHLQQQVDNLPRR